MYLIFLVQAISHLLVKAVSTLSSETLPILRLTAISDEAEKKVVQKIWCLRPTIQENILLVGLFQVYTVVTLFMYC